MGIAISSEGVATLIEGHVNFGYNLGDRKNGGTKIQEFLSKIASFRSQMFIIYHSIYFGVSKSCGATTLTGHLHEQKDLSRSATGKVVCTMLYLPELHYTSVATHLAFNYGFPFIRPS